MEGGRKGKRMTDGRMEGREEVRSEDGRNGGRNEGRRQGVKRGSEGLRTRRNGGLDFQVAAFVCLWRQGRLVVGLLSLRWQRWARDPTNSPHPASHSLCQSVQSVSPFTHSHLFGHSFDYAFHAHSGRLTNRRAAIRKIFNHVFAREIYEPMPAYRGISEILDILASIINGFACPIKDEHKHMLYHYLIPLHKLPQEHIYYHQQLHYCMILFAGKDHTFTTDIIRGILKYWCVTNMWVCLRLGG
jgi:hypothetical protein